MNEAIQIPHKTADETQKLGATVSAAARWADNLCLKLPVSTHQLANQTNWLSCCNAVNRSTPLRPCAIVQCWLAVPLRGKISSDTRLEKCEVEAKTTRERKETVRSWIFLAARKCTVDCARYD